MDKRKWFFLAAAIFWMAMIFSFSSQKAEQSSEISGGLTYRMAEKVGQLSFLDWEEEQINYYGELWEHPVRKAAHMTEYAVLSVLLLGNFSQYSKTKSKRFLYAELGAVFYAATDEFHQLFVEGRSGQLSDVCIDGTGALIGLLLAWGMISIWKKRINPIR